jgi:hypothetical protein
MLKTILIIAIGLILLRFPILLFALFIAILLIAYPETQSTIGHVLTGATIMYFIYTKGEYYD